MKAARLVYETYTCPLNFETASVDDMRRSGMITASYQRSSKVAAYDLAHVLVFDFLQQFDSTFSLVLETSVTVKPFFRQSLASLLPTIPTRWDVLFLNCSPGCRIPGSVVHPLSASQATVISFLWHGVDDLVVCAQGCVRCWTLRPATFCLLSMLFASLVYLCFDVLTLVALRVSICGRLHRVKCNPSGNYVIFTPIIGPMAGSYPTSC
jgi:hypothetical protein